VTKWRAVHTTDSISDIDRAVMKPRTAKDVLDAAETAGRQSWPSIDGSATARRDSGFA